MSTATALVPGMTGMVETTYRLLVPERHTGSIIGKRGEVGKGFVYKPCLFRKNLLISSSV